MKQEHDHPGAETPEPEVPERDEYLRGCDFSALTESDWRRIGAQTLGVILTHRPELYESCRRWISLSRETWAELLRVRPELAEKCCCWGEFSAVELLRILKKQPQLARHVLNWQVLNESAWALLLLSRPELAEYCPYWIDFHLAALWIGESVIAAQRENAEELQRNVPWKTSVKSIKKEKTSSDLK